MHVKVLSVSVQGVGRAEVTSCHSLSLSLAALWTVNETEESSEGGVYYTSPSFSGRKVFMRRLQPPPGHSALRRRQRVEALQEVLEMWQRPPVAHR